MSLIDIFFAIIYISFFAYGLVFGFIHKLGRIFAFAVGTVTATQLYFPVFSYLSNYDQGYHNIAKALIFIVIFALGSQIALSIFNILKKTLSFVSFIPLLPLLNRLAGAVLGILLSSALIVLLLFLSAKFHILDTWVASQLGSSFLLPYILEIKNIIIPFLPDTIGQFMNIFE